MTTSPLPLEPWFLAGPPFGPSLFAAVRDRLGDGRLGEVVDDARPGDGWAARGAALAEAVTASPRPALLVAHGLALPAAIEAARQSGARLLVTNGPLTRLDPVSAAVARVAGLAPGAIAAGLRPSPWLAWLRSSAGLRRAVVNPYVMDRDTVAALCLSRVQTATARRATVAYLASLAAGLPDLAAPPSGTWLAWGDEDPLYPASEADFLDARLGGGRRIDVPGGRWLHPVERPWAFADVVATVARMPGGSGATRTSMS